MHHKIIARHQSIINCRLPYYILIYLLLYVKHLNKPIYALNMFLYELAHLYYILLIQNHIFKHVAAKSVSTSPLINIFVMVKQINIYNHLHRSIISTLKVKII